MSVKYGLNTFKNNADESTSVIIDNGKLRELGVPPGNVNEFINNIYIIDTMGRKQIVPITDAIIQTVSIMSDDDKENLRKSVLGDIEILPSTVTGIVPYILNNDDLGTLTEFIIYGKNMCINDTSKTSISLIDKDTSQTYNAVGWNPINKNQIQASFKIPKTCTSKILFLSVKVGDIEVQSTAEIIINKYVSYEPQPLEFTTFGDESKVDLTTSGKIIFSPLFNENIGADCISVTSNDIDINKNFILTADLSINTISGGSLNSFDLTRSGFGLGYAGEAGEIRFDDVNMDLVDFKPRFNTFHTKDNIKHVKFIKHSKMLYKILYSDDCVYTYKTILTDSDNLAVCASMQRLDENGNIQSVTYSNIKLKTY